MPESVTARAELAWPVAAVYRRSHMWAAHFEVQVPSVDATTAASAPGWSLAGYRGWCASVIGAPEARLAAGRPAVVSRGADREERHHRPQLRARLRPAGAAAPAGPGQDPGAAVARRHRLPGRRHGAGGRLWDGCPDGDAGPQQSRGGHHGRGCLSRLAGCSRDEARRGRTGQRCLPPGGHLRSALRAGFLRPRVCLLRLGASRPAGPGAGPAGGGAQTGWDDHGDRGRSRLGLLPP